jgi:TonB-dependent starch-binding outer membrane protein SusC
MEISRSGRGLHCAIMKPLYSELLRVMRLTALLLIIGCLHVSANTYSQTVSFKGKNVPLQTVFASFEKQTGLSFFFNYALIKDVKPVTVDVREMPLEDALTSILTEQGLSYYRTGKTIFIVKQEKAIVESLGAAAPDAKQVDVTGKVTNQQGEGLVGASVETRNGKRATVTDAKGTFQLKNLPVGSILIISYTGYQKKEVTINDGVAQTVVLAIADNQLDKAQVIAYGTTTERLSTGNVTTVTAKEIEQQPVSNPLLALEGRVPGLNIVQTNGMPGSPVTVRIQGQNSITNGNDPFYVVDGVPYSSTALQTISTSGGNPFDFLNPSDIESITVLKDADATAIYGSRAANGAILITTKKGKAGDARVNFNLQNGYGHITKEMSVMNTQEYIRMRLEAINSDGVTIQPTDYDVNGTWDTTRNINWQKTLIGGTAEYTNLNGTVSGGSVSTQYMVGGTYNRQTSVFPGNFADQKGSLHISVTTASANKKFHFQVTGSYLVENNRLPGTDLSQTAFGLSPDAPPLYNADGSINWALDQNGNSTWGSSSASTNPLSYTLSKYGNKNNNLVGNSVVSYQILPGLEIKSSFGYTNQQVNEVGITPLTATAPAQQPYSSPGASYTYNNSNSWVIEPQLDYRKNSGMGRFECLVGSTAEQNNTNQLSLNSYGYSSDLLLGDPIAAGTLYVDGSTSSTYKYAALFARISYSWEDKYLLNVTARRDGSSRFGSANEYHDFGAIGVGWIFTKENWVQNNLSFLSFGKLKGSYGTTGNDQIGNYSFLSLYQPYGQLPYQGVVPISPQGLTNPYLQWEETKKAEIGLDLGFLKDRILINGTYVRNRSSNELLGYTLPIITGFTSINRNFPATVQNSEWEFTLNTVNIKTSHFTWSSHFNLTIPENKLISFPGLESSSYASSLEVGKPILGARKVYHSLGVNDTTGVYQFADVKGDPTSNPNYGTDNNVFLSVSPKFYGGFGNNIQYKGLELDVLLQFVKQVGQNYTFGSYPGSLGRGNQPVYVLNAWRKPGDHAEIQRYATSFSYFFQWLDAVNSDASFSDASFVRLKNVSLSWQLPANWNNRTGLQVCRIYIQGQNLLTITHYKGMDPENPSGGSGGLPPLRILTAGIQAIF